MATRVARKTKAQVAAEVETETEFDRTPGTPEDLWGDEATPCAKTQFGPEAEHKGHHVITKPLAIAAALFSLLGS